MHSIRVTRVFAALVIAASTLLLANPVTAADPPEPNIVAEFDELIAYIQTIPDAELNKGQKNAFSQRVENARRQYVQGQACASANMLGAHMNQAQAIRRAKSVAAAEQLYNRGRRLRDAVVRSAAPPNPCADPASGQLPAVQIAGSDNRHFSAQISFGSPTLNTAVAGGETWTQVSLPGIENLLGAPGMPSVPSWQALVAIPRGASPRFSTNRALVREQLLLNLFPFQDQAADQESGRFVDEPLPPRDTFKDPPFAKNAGAYQVSGFVPPNPCAVRIIDSVRDLVVAQVQCNAGQYDPVSDQMVLFSSVEFDIAFDGGDGKFSTSQIVSPFEPASSSLVSNVLNSVAVVSHLE